MHYYRLWQTIYAAMDEEWIYFYNTAELEYKEALVSHNQIHRTIMQQSGTLISREEYLSVLPAITRLIFTSHVPE